MDEARRAHVLLRSPGELKTLWLADRGGLRLGPLVDINENTELRLLLGFLR